MRVLILCLTGLLSLSSVSFGAVLTTEAQIRQAIIGNTVSGTEDGKPYTEYFLPDGHLRGMAPDGPYAGEWRISGRKFCERSFEDGDRVCMTAAMWCWRLIRRLGMHGRRDRGVSLCVD